MRSQKTILSQYDFQDMFKAYTSTTCRVNLKYTLELQRIQEQGIKILEKIVDDYCFTRKQPKNNKTIAFLEHTTSDSIIDVCLVEGKQNDAPERTVPTPKSNNKPNLPIDPLSKKEFIQQQQDYSTPRKGIYFHKKKKAKPGVEIKIKRSHENQQAEDKILKEMKEMSVDERFSFGTGAKQKVKKFLQEGQLIANKHCSASELSKSKRFAEDGMQNSISQSQQQSFNEKQNKVSNQMSESDGQVPDYIKKHSLFELIEQTNRKIKQAANQQNQNGPTSLLQSFLHENESLTYQMTDYSSNESSNDDNYDKATQLKYQLDVQNLEKEIKSDKPLFGGHFSNYQGSHQIKQGSQSSLNSNVYKTMQQLPKNTDSLNFLPFSQNSILKSAKKTNQTKRLFIKNKKIPKWGQDLQLVKRIQIMQRKVNDPLKIFGYLCIEEIDSNKIFKLYDAYRRFSSAKWRNKNLFVI